MGISRQLQLEQHQEIAKAVTGAGSSGAEQLALTPMSRIETEVQTDVGEIEAKLSWWPWSLTLTQEAQAGAVMQLSSLMGLRHTWVRIVPFSSGPERPQPCSAPPADPFDLHLPAAGPCCPGSPPSPR